LHFQNIHLDNFSAVPRFGHTSDIIELLFGDRADYISGVLFIPAFIFTFLIVWGLILIILRCMGERVGFFSGREFIHEKEGCKECGRLSRNGVSRLLVLLSAIGLIICAIIFPTKGAVAVNETFETVRDWVDVSQYAFDTIMKCMSLIAESVFVCKREKDLGQLIDDTSDAANNLLSLVNETVPIRDQLILTVENGICEAVGETGELDSVDSKIGEVIDLLEDIGTFERDEMEAVKDTIEETYSSVETMILDGLDSGGTYDRWLPFYTIPMMIMGCLLVLGSLLSWFLPKTSKQFFVLQTWLTLPMLGITIVSSIIITGILAPTLIANSGEIKADAIMWLSTSFFLSYLSECLCIKTSASVTSQALQMETYDRSSII
jgi:hypothetical protein